MLNNFPKSQISSTSWFSASAMFQYRSRGIESYDTGTAPVGPINLQTMYQLPQKLKYGKLAQDNAVFLSTNIFVVENATGYKSYWKVKATLFHSIFLYVFLPLSSFRSCCLPLFSPVYKTIFPFVLSRRCTDQHRIGTTSRPGLESSHIQNETCTRKKPSHTGSQIVAGTNAKTCFCFVCEAGARVRLGRMATPPPVTFSVYQSVCLSI